MIKKMVDIALIDGIQYFLRQYSRLALHKTNV